MGIKAKEPWVAVFLNRLLPGLGYFYTKNSTRAIIVLTIALLLVFTTISAMVTFAKNDMSVTPQILTLVAIFTIFSFLFSLFVLIDGYLCARKYNLANNIKPSNIGTRVFAILGTVVLLLTGGFAAFPAIYVRTNLIQVFKMPATSMSPTIKLEDKIIVDRRAYRKSDPQRGDIVVFLPPHDRKKWYVKRIVGMPEENLEIKDGAIYVNDEKINSPNIANVFYYNQGDYAKEGKKINIPANKYYVLGDNSISSLDSRFWGSVSMDDIMGKVTKIYWPPERSGKIK